MKKFITSLTIIASLAIQSNDMPIRTRDKEAPIQQKILPNFVGALPKNFKYRITRPIERTTFGTTILIVGEPGTGKTLLVNEIIQESGLDTIRIPVKEIYSKPIPEQYKSHGHYIGSLIKSAFKTANTLYKKSGESVIIFIDDLDLAFPGNGHYGTMCVLSSSTLPDIQDNCKYIKFIATATNIDLLPNDLPYRRIDPVIFLSLPDYKSRKTILEFHLKQHDTENNINLSTIALASHGFSGENLVQVVHDAVKLAHERADSQKITQTDLWAAFKPLWQNIVQPQLKDSTKNFLVDTLPPILTAIAAIMAFKHIKNKKNNK